MTPHPSRHCIFSGKPLQLTASCRVLTSKEEVVVFVQQRAMEGNKSLPLLVVDLVVRCGGLRRIHLDALGLQHDKPRVNTLDLSNQLLVGDGFRLWLRDTATLVFIVARKRTF